MEYFTFDIVHFLKDARKWSAKIEELEKKYHELEQFNEMCILDGVTVLVAKERIQLEIEGIKAYQKALDTAIFTLNTKEREILMGFFFSETPASVFVENWKKKYHSNQRYCYLFRAKVLDKMAKHLLEYYNPDN